MLSSHIVSFHFASATVVVVSSQSSASPRSNCSSPPNFVNGHMPTWITFMRDVG